MHRKKESFNVIFSCNPCAFFPKYDQQKNIYVQIKVESFFLRKSQSAIIFHLSESWPAQDTAAIVTWFIWKLHKSHKTVSEYFQMNVHRVGILLFTIERMASLKMKKTLSFFLLKQNIFFFFKSIESSGSTVCVSLSSYQHGNLEQINQNIEPEFL